MRIINISVYANSQFDKKIFEWNDSGKSIILFHLKNGTGKTTLYTIARNLLSGRQMDCKKIDTNIFGGASMEIEHNGMIIKLRNNQTDFYWGIDGKDQEGDFQEFMMTNVFLNTENYKIFYGGDKTSLSSLLRLSFFTDNDFVSRNSKSTDLFSSQFDGDGKYVLFLFCLGVILDKKFNWNDIFEKTNKLKQLRMEYDGIKSEVENNENAKKVKKTQESLFSESLTGDGYKLCQSNKITIQNLNEIVKKISILIEKSKYFELEENFIEFLGKERDNIQNGIKELEEDVSDFEENFYTFSLSPNDLLNYEQKKKRMQVLEKEIGKIEEVLNKFFNLYDNVFDGYLKIVEKIKQNKNYCIDFSVGKDLTITRATGSDGILKGCKFLSDIACQIYAIKNKGKVCMSLFPFGFYDGVFQGADEDVILECLNALLDIEPEVLKQLQVFCFINKYSSENSVSMIDKFADDNADFVDKVSMKPGKKYLIGNS